MTIMGACLLPLVYAKLHKLCPVMPGLDPGIHLLAQESLRREWIAGSSPRLSGSILVDGVHGMDSSVF